MKFQQNSHQDENVVEVNFDQMEGKYMNFYANLDIGGSQNQSSESDNLDIQLHEFLEGNLRNCECTNRQAYQNPGVAQIPTIYLVTTIRTEQLPQRKRWRDFSAEKTKKINAPTFQITYLRNTQAKQCTLKKCPELRKKDSSQKLGTTSYFFLNERVILADKVIQRIQVSSNSTERPWKTESVNKRLDQWKKKQPKRSLHPRRIICERSNCKQLKQISQDRQSSIRRVAQIAKQNLLKIIQAYEVNNNTDLFCYRNKESQMGEIVPNWRTIKQKSKRNLSQPRCLSECKSNKAKPFSYKNEREQYKIYRNKRSRPECFAEQKQKNKYKINDY